MNPTPTAPPLVSAFMSVYNGGDYLRPAVESVLAQTFPDFEFIIINDGSTDGTRTYLDSLPDPRVRVHHQENQGLGTPLNKWLKQCRGTYVMRLDADDICRPNRMQRQVEFLGSRPEVILVGSQYQLFAGDRHGPASKLPEDHDSIVGGMLKGWHTLSHATIMWRRSLLDHIDGYAFSGAGEDWSFLLDASRFGKLAILPDVLYATRFHLSSSSTKGAERVIAGFTYARRRHHHAASGIEYPVDRFLEEWNRRPAWRRAITKLQATSSVLFRESVVDGFAGKTLQARMKLALAAALDPHRSLGALWKRLSSRPGLAPSPLSSPERNTREDGSVPGLSGSLS